MTLYTSDYDFRKTGKTAFIYLLVSGFCVFFGFVYEQFSHGVYSMDMIYAFAYPLFGGAIPFLALALFHRNPGSCQALYHCGIATLTLGSLIEGVLKIYGTDSRLTLFYPWAGWILVSLGVVFWFFRTFRQKN